MRPRKCRWPTPFSCHSGGPASGPARRDGRPVTSAAIYARVCSARQKKDETIGSQTAALREHAAQARLDVPAEWVFEDEGHSGATLVRPALEALRDLVAQGCVDVVLVYSPDRLARKFAYQALLVAEVSRRSADEGAAIADRGGWRPGRGASPGPGKRRWDRSVIWGMLRTPAYAGCAVFGKTMATSGPPGLTRVARLQGRATPRAVKTVDRPREEWLEIPVPAIVDQDTFPPVPPRLQDNNRFPPPHTQLPPP